MVPIQHLPVGARSESTPKVPSGRGPITKPHTSSTWIIRDSHRAPLLWHQFRPCLDRCQRQPRNWHGSMENPVKEPIDRWLQLSNPVDAVLTPAARIIVRTGVHWHAMMWKWTLRIHDPHCGRWLRYPSCIAGGTMVGDQKIPTPSSPWNLRATRWTPRYTWSALQTQKVHLFRYPSCI